MVNLNVTEIIIALISFCGIIISALITKNSLIKELEKKNAIIETKLDNQAADIKEHNHYAKLFSETMPVVQEQIKNINYRIDRLETTHAHFNGQSIQ